MRLYFLLLMLSLGTLCFADDSDQDEAQPTDRGPSSVEQVTPAPADSQPETTPATPEPKPDPRRPYPYLENDRNPT